MITESNAANKAESSASGLCGACRETFSADLLDDDGLCLICEVRRDEGENAALILQDDLEAEAWLNDRPGMNLDAHFAEVDKEHEEWWAQRLKQAKGIIKDMERARYEDEIGKGETITEVYLADSFSRLVGDDGYRFDRLTCIWYQWGDSGWEEEKGDMMADIRGHVERMVAKCAGTDRKRWLSLSTLKAIRELLRYTAIAEDFAPNPAHIGLTSVDALDTTTGEVFINQFEHHLTRRLEISPGAKVSSKWTGFIHDSLAHYDPLDRIVIAHYLKLWAGSALAGDCSPEQMLFLYGPPGSGKSTFLDTLASVFGGLATTIQGSRLMANNSGHLQWLAGLSGKRLLAVREIPERGQWAADYLNELISGGMIEANRMRQDSFTYRSQVHIAATGNHRPKASGASGLWRRMALIQFRNQPERDQRLGKALKEEAPGILTWLLEGLRAYNEAGRTLDVPTIIKADVEEYRVSADAIAQYVKERLVCDPEGSLTNADLEADFAAWWEDNMGGNPPGKRTLANALTDLELPKSVNVHNVRRRNGWTLAQ